MTDTLDEVATPVPTDEPAPVRPFVPDDQSPAELTPGAVILGMLLGVMFAASSVYLALKIGLTVSASIPIAVLSITIFKYVSRAFGVRPATILQNNIVQTTGSAGESIASGTVFTLPALLLLGYSLPWGTVAVIAVIGSILGVVLMIPLRKSLIVDEHATLKYPEGTACAQVLIAGERGGLQARTIFMGFGLGVLYKFINNGMRVWTDVARQVFERAVPGGKPALIGEIQAEVSPELCGVGYIIGARISGYLFAGGVFTYFVMIPAIKLFGAALANPIFPATKLIADMSASDIRSNYTYYIGAGAVTAAGIISLIRALPTIASSFANGIRGFRRRGARTTERRTMRDLPITVVIGGVALSLVAIVTLPQVRINFVGALLAIFFAFLFVTVSSRITGQIGNSSNPISGMTVATVLLTALLFYFVGWTGVQYRVLALSIGGVVCIAAAVAGATSQDLKTGYLVGATPSRQQTSLFFGAVTSALMVGGIIHLLDTANTTIVSRDLPGVQVDSIEPQPTTFNGQAYHVGHLYERRGPAGEGRYLVDAAGTIRYLIDPGIGGHEAVGADWTGKTREVRKLDSPKSQIMALVVDGILTRKLNWGLILIGAFFAIVMEILGIPSLPVATGSYLPISTTATMFLGGVVRWLVEKRLGEKAKADADSGPGVLFSSGLIAGGAITGVLLAVLSMYALDARYNIASRLGTFADNPLVALSAFVLFLAIPLYRVATKSRL